MPTLQDSTLVRRVIPYQWPLALIAGVVIVAVAAQVAVPLSFTPVPITLQGLAVILVGGLFGAAAGAGAMVLYLTLGSFGVPVFAMGTSGLAKLFGPTGGYLLAFPLAALVTGAVARRGNVWRCALAALLGMVTIHVGGLAQLTILTGHIGRAARLGTVPFLAADLLKVIVAALILTRFDSALRPRA